MFDNLQAYYDYLESENGLALDFNLSKNVLKLRNSVDDTIEKSKCTYEIYFLDFRIEKGMLKPYLSNAGDDGITSGYPNLSLFEDDFEYLKSRAKATINPKYKAKYNHILWASKHKHNDFAKIAIDSYITFLNGVSFLLTDTLVHRLFADYFENVIVLSQISNYRKEDSLQLLTSRLGHQVLNGFQECSMLKFAVEHGKCNRDILTVFLEYSQKIITDNIYPDFLQSYLELQLLLAQKLNMSPKPYHNQLGDFHLGQSERHKGSFVIHDFYLKALAQYKKAGDKNKMEEVTVLIEKAKRTMNFKPVKFEYTDDKVQMLFDTMEKVTDELIEKGTSEDIYEYIILSKNIFPKADVLDIQVRPMMFELMNVMNFDINRNVADNKKDGISSYYSHIRNFSLRHLSMIFSKGIINGKISFETLSHYLWEHTWYGNDMTYRNEEGEIEGFNWRELLSPSLQLFFTQSEVEIRLQKQNSEAYILAIDSLTIKFEGLLREFSRNIGAQTIEIKENGTQERISFEKLLDNTRFTNVIPKDDVALFKFLFTSEGLNLRNNVAHCFYKTDNYSPGIMFLLISALLKLGNYKFEIREGKKLTSEIIDAKP